MSEQVARAINKLSESRNLTLKAEELEADAKSLREQATKLKQDAQTLAQAVVVDVKDGLSSEVDLNRLNAAFSAFHANQDPIAAAEAAEAELPSEEMAPQTLEVATVSADVRTLLEAVEAALPSMPQEFKAKAMREHLARVQPQLLEKVHPASVTASLSRLVELGKLDRVGSGGRGKEAIFRKKSEE